MEKKKEKTNLLELLLRGDVVRLLERSGCAADARGQIRGPTWRRAPAVGHGRTAGGALAPAASVPSHNLSLWLKQREENNKNLIVYLLLFFIIRFPWYEHDHAVVSVSVVRPLPVR